MSHTAPAGVYCDVLIGYIHGSQQGHLSMWMAIIDLPPACRVELLNWVKECEELHQHPILGRKPLPDGVLVMESHIHEPTQSASFREPTQSAPVREPTQSVPGAHAFRSGSPLRSGNPQSPFQAQPHPGTRVCLFLQALFRFTGLARHPGLPSFHLPPEPCFFCVCV